MAEIAPPVPTEQLFLDRELIESYAPMTFGDLYVTPAGPKGLEYTTRLKALEGQRVRMTGFMVRIVNQDPDVFMFSDRPVSTHSCQIGGIPDVPVTVVHAILAAKPGCGTAWQPYAVTVFGRLELGGREEKDGRYSYIRIRADHVTVGERFQTVDLQIPLVRRVLRQPEVLRER